MLRNCQLVNFLKTLYRKNSVTWEVFYEYANRYNGNILESNSFGQSVKIFTKIVDGHTCQSMKEKKT